MQTVYVSIGNSDDNLSQREWSEYCRDVNDALRPLAERVHGEWYSVPNSRYQNACWCIEIVPEYAAILKRRLAGTAEKFEQDSIAWAVVDKTHFIEGER